MITAAEICAGFLAFYAAIVALIAIFERIER
jgi:hypothetical protein